MNARFADEETELSDSLSRSGKGSMLASLRAIDGTVAAPAVAFTAEPASGMWRAGANDVRLAVGGVDALKLTGGGVSGPLVLAAGTTALQVTLANGFAVLQGNLAAGQASDGAHPADVVASPTVTRTAGFVFQVQNPPGVGALAVDYQGLLRLQNAAAIQPASLYTTVTPNAGWNTSATIAYWKDCTGVVRMKGSAAFVSGSNPVFTLPAGYRPAGQINHLSMFAIGGPLLAIVINPSGTVSIQNQSTGALASGAFDGLSFLAEA